MNKEELLKEIEETKKHLANLEEQVNSIDENKRWKPKDGEIYYCINDCGNINTWTYYDVKPVHRKCFLIGNCFKTKEEANFEIERLKVLEELKEFSYEFSDEEWNCNNIRKYFIYYSYNSDEIDSYDETVCKDDKIYFKSEEDCEKAIAQIGKERLKKYYFKIGV